MLTTVSNKLAYSLGEVCVCVCVCVCVVVGEGGGEVKSVSMKDNTRWMIQRVFTVFIIIIINISLLLKLRFINFC